MSDTAANKTPCPHCGFPAISTDWTGTYCVECLYCFDCGGTGCDACRVDFVCEEGGES